jgi:hypothetical protein
MAKSDMLAAARRWTLHCKRLSNRWWAVIAVAWSVFSGIATTIGIWGSAVTKTKWTAFTLHFPFGWQTWLIGLLVIGLLFVYDGSYRHARKLETEKANLEWSSDRPILLFDSWGEVPHDFPGARFIEVSEYRKEREYFQRGFFLTNQGGTAHEIYLAPVQLWENVFAISAGATPRIDPESQGFVMAQMHLERNARFGEDNERWDLLKAMAALERKINASRVEEEPLKAEATVFYRDVRGIWFASYASFTYKSDTKSLVFEHTKQYPQPIPLKVVQETLTRQ